jgi:predicted transporter
MTYVLVIAVLLVIMGIRNGFSPGWREIEKRPTG